MKQALSLIRLLALFVVVVMLAYAGGQEKSVHLAGADCPTTAGLPFSAQAHPPRKVAHPRPPIGVEKQRTHLPHFTLQSEPGRQGDLPLILYLFLDSRK